MADQQENTFKKFFRWSVGTIAGDIFMRVLVALVASAGAVWKLYQPVLSEGLAKMSIPAIIGISFMFFGVFVTSLLVFASIIWLIKKAAYAIRGHSKVHNKKQEKELVANWDGVDFIEWNPRMNNTSAKCGVEIINNSGNKISECFVELVALFEENNGEYMNIYEEIESHLPCMLAWQIHNEFVYGKIEIEKTDNPYLAISYLHNNEMNSYLYIRGEKDFMYTLPRLGHVVAKIRVWGKIGIESLPAKNLFIEMFANDPRVITKGITEIIQQLNPLLSRFSIYLDDMMRDGNISPSGISFLNKAKIAPPFLGIQQSILHPKIEQNLTEYFQAVEYKNTHEKSIYVGGNYTVTDGETTWESISKKKYGSAEFTNLLRESNPLAHKPRTGMVIELPYIDKRNPSELLSKDIERKLSLAQYSSIEPTIKLLINQFYLLEDEALNLITMIYTAAQRTRNKENKENESFIVYDGLTLEEDVDGSHVAQYVRVGAGLATDVKLWVIVRNTNKYV